jgi:hypothetical protein
VHPAAKSDARSGRRAALKGPAAPVDAWHVTFVRRIWWLPASLATAAVAWLDARPQDADLVYFTHRGEELLSDGWREVYGDAALQAGPLQLLVLGGPARVADALGAAPWALGSFTVQLGLAALLLATAARLAHEASGTPRPLLAGAAGLVAVAAGLFHGAYVDGHPAQVAIPLLWLLAGLDARGERAWRAGALVGLAAGLETWGALGAPALLLARGRARTASGAAALGAAVLALYLPLALAGDFRMFDYRWQVATTALAGLLVEPGTAFPWPLRFVQGALALGAAALATHRLRASVHALWAAPLAAVAVRLVLDPVRYPWYWLAPATLALAALAALAASPPSAVAAAFRRARTV